MQWICIIFSFILVAVCNVCCFCIGKPYFPFGTKHNAYYRKKGQSGFTVIFQLGNPMIQFFLRSFLGSSTKQQITLSQVENLKEILCSSGTKFRLLAGSRGFYGDWKGTSFGNFPYTCVSACIQTVGTLELSIFSLAHKPSLLWLSLP